MTGKTKTDSTAPATETVADKAKLDLSVLDSLEPETVENVPAAKSVENQMTPHVRKLSESWDDEDGKSRDALAVTIPASHEKVVRRMISDAASALETPRTPTIRVRTQAGANEKPIPEGHVRLVFGLRTKIKQNRKPKDGEVTETSAE